MDINELKIGQIIFLRNRLWRIDLLYSDTKFMDLTRLDGYEAEQRTFYIPKEIENIQLSESSFPDINNLGDSSWIKMYIQAWKLSLMFSDSPFISLHKASIIPTKFQLVPVLMALKYKPIRLLIADDVGLGKTIEAGMILSELMARQMIRKILIITPSNLREQWKEVLYNCFHHKFEILSQFSRKSLEREIPSDSNPWQYYQRIITSIDYIKREEQLLSASQSEFDLIIVDEVHLCARPHQNNRSESRMLRWEMLNVMGKKTKNLLLLSATPHNGYRDSYASILSILNSDLIENNFHINIEKAKHHVCQRTRNDLVKWISEDFNPFPDNTDKKVEYVQFTEGKESKIYNEIIEYHSILTSSLVSNVKKKNQSDFFILHLLKRFISSPYALQKSLENRLSYLTFEKGLNIDIDDTETNSYINETDLNDTIESEEAGDKIEKNRFSESVNEFEINIIQKLIDEIRTIKKGSKYKYLAKNVITELLEYDNHIIIFTRYKDTQDFLINLLQKDFKSISIYKVHGEMSYNSRIDVLSQFEKSNKGILVTTDCLSEGINLQYLSSCLIHYEIPWNPNRLEQRNGRIDRYGQIKKNVHIRSIVTENTIDNFILHKIIQKTEEIKKAYGFAPPFLPDDNKIAEMLVKAKFKPNNDNVHQMSLFDIVDETEIEIDPDWKEKIDCIKSDSYYGQMHYTLPEIDEQVMMAEKKVGSEEDIRNFIITALTYYSSDIEEIEDEVYSIRLKNPKLKLANNQDKFDRITFSKEKSAKTPGLELISIGHPLIERLNQVIITEQQQGKYSRITYTGSDSIKYLSAILQIKATWVSNSKPISLFEDLLSIGYDIYNNEVFSPNQTELINSKNQFVNKQPEDILEFVRKIESTIKTTDLVRKAVEQYSENMKIKKESEQKSLNSYVWAEGLSELELVRYDVLTVKVVFPI